MTRNEINHRIYLLMQLPIKELEARQEEFNELIEQLKELLSV